jgi:hypothetical protein
MTVTLSTENIYLAIIGLLMVVQVFQWRSIFRLKDEVDSVWNQMAILVGTFGKEVKELQDKIHDIRK